MMRIRLLHFIFFSSCIIGTHKNELSIYTISDKKKVSADCFRSKVNQPNLSVNFVDIDTKNSSKLELDFSGLPTDVLDDFAISIDSIKPAIARNWFLALGNFGPVPLILPIYISSLPPSRNEKFFFEKKCNVLFNNETKLTLVLPRSNFHGSIYLKNAPYLIQFGFKNKDMNDLTSDLVENVGLTCENHLLLENKTKQPFLYHGDLNLSLCPIFDLLNNDIINIKFTAMAVDTKKNGRPQYAIEMTENAYPKK